jgi:hypothetical protein
LQLSTANQTSQLGKRGGIKTAEIPSDDPGPFRVINRCAGNLLPMLGVLPHYPAPVIRNTNTGREWRQSLAHAATAAHARAAGENILNTTPHWRACRITRCHMLANQLDNVHRCAYGPSCMLGVGKFNRAAGPRG